MERKPIKATVRPAENPPSRERLGEIAEQLLRLLAEERAEKKRREVKPDGPHSDAA
jgi:hypothetical protein